MKNKNLIYTEYTAGQLISLAHDACTRAEEVYPESITAIVLASLAVEAFVNELTHNMQHPITHKHPANLDTLGHLIKDLDTNRGNLNNKVDVIYYFLTNKKPPRGDSVYQNFTALIELRNKLVHSRPNRYSTADDPIHNDPGFMKLLFDQSIVDRSAAKTEYSWHTLIQHPKVAKWAYSSAVNLIKDIWNLLPAGEESTYVVLGYSPLKLCEKFSSKKPFGRKRSPKT
ncbi:MAG: hypothetical protein PHD86_00485 [Kiritimatiellae bacterium]|nr:hypothetical protein [Kiritimatiellia bacterium]